MSCEDCEKIQKLNKQGIELAFRRVGEANVLISACNLHFNMLLGRKSNYPVVRMNEAKEGDER